MKEKYVLILGANSDIAKELSVFFAKDRFNLYLASRNTESLKKLKYFLESKYNIKAEVLYFDACDFNSHKKFYDDLNIKPVGVVVAFGYLGNQLKAQEDFKEFKKIFETNFLGASRILEIISKDLEKRKRGFIIGISSVAGDKGRKENYFYGASKGAFSIYLEGLKSRLAKSNINVLTVKPGWVKTKMTKNLNVNRLFLANPKKVARDIYLANKKKKEIIYTPKFWKYIMFFYKKIPHKSLNS